MYKRQDVYSVIAYKLFHIKSLSAYAEGAVHDVVWLIRLPRVLLALAVGMALSVCGVVMQAIVQNPLADPYVLGISSGAVSYTHLAKSPLPPWLQKMQPFLPRVPSRLGQDMPPFNATR